MIPNEFGCLVFPVEPQARQHFDLSREISHHPPDRLKQNYIQDSQRINSNNFSDPLTFPLVSYEADVFRFDFKIS